MSEAVILHGDAVEQTRTLSDDSIHCVITSPPYPNGRFHVKPDAFAVWLAPLLAELARVVAPTGSIMLNLGRVFKDGFETAYLEQTLDMAASIGWKRIDTIVWTKPNANPRGGRYLTDAHEFVYWLARRPDAYRGLDDARRPYAAESIARLNRRWLAHGAVKGADTSPHRRKPHPLGARPSSVIECQVGREKGNPHPTPMPLELAVDLVVLGCPPGGRILDPFAGSGTTGTAAISRGRDFVGVELDEEVARYARQRISGVTPPLL